MQLSESNNMYRCNCIIFSRRSENRRKRERVTRERERKREGKRELEGTHCSKLSVDAF